MAVARFATGGNDSLVAGTTSPHAGSKEDTGNPHRKYVQGRTGGGRPLRKILIQCQKPNCRAHHVALLQNEPPPTGPLCIACNTPLPPTVDGEFVYFAVSASTSTSRTMQAAPDHTAATPRSVAPLTSTQAARMAPLLIVKSLQQSLRSRWQRFHPA